MFKKNLILIILYLSFVSIGLPDSALGVAWPEMRLDFKQSLDKLGILVSIVILCSAISGYSSGYIAKRFSIAQIIIISTILIVIGLLGYAVSQSWLFMLMAGVPFGLGAGAIDCSLNNYAAKNLSSRHVNWLHGFWGIGTTLGPVIITSMYAFDLSWRIGFAIILAILILLLVTFIATRNIWQSNETETKKEIKGFVLSPDAVLSCLFFGVYVTLESSVGLWYYSYLIDYKMIDTLYAGAIISAYWGVFAIGRFGVGYVSKWITDTKIISISIVIAIVCLIFALFDFYAAIVVLGFALAGIYPCMVTLTHKRFKPEIAEALMGQQIGSSYLALVILVPAIGVISDKYGLNYLVPVFITLGVVLFLLNLRLKRLVKK